MELFPVFYGMDGRRVALFGGGELALRKFRLLAKTPAEIVVFSDAPDADFLAEAEDRIDLFSSEAASEHLEDVAFAIIALEDDEKAEDTAAFVKAHHIPINVVDRPKLCDFTVPSILDRGQVVAGIATGGAAPILARDIRAKLEALMPKRLGELARFARSYRPQVKTKFDQEKDRRSFWETVLRGSVGEAVLAGDLQKGERLMAEKLASDEAEKGIVHIVGAGPGDPELLTLKALRIIQDADIVYFDRLVSDEIMDLVRRDADRVPVGKSKGDHSVPQNEIHQKLISSADEGKRVVRLKGGDPFIFGRGGEELEAVRAAGIEVQIVPGISSALGCAASVGLPLTHRDYAQAVTFVTGHAKSGENPDLDWQALINPNQTVVVFMGVGTAPKITSNLLRAGRSGNTPVAVIENGTRANEITAYGELSDLPDLIVRSGIRGPALLIIGDVAAIPAEALKAARKELELAA